MPKTHLNNGRSNKPESFIRIPKWINDCGVWRQRLSPTDRNVWIEAVAVYNGRNNGYLALPCRAIADKIGVSHHTVARSLNNLVTFGFIEISKKSTFSQKDRQASEYRLTHLYCDKTHTQPSNLFMHLGKGKNSSTSALHSSVGETVVPDSSVGETVIPFPKRERSHG
jgi:hypothetical protein